VVMGTPEIANTTTSESEIACVMVLGSR
jgi:hypothetical protein